MSDKTSLYRERMCIKIRSESSCSINGKVSSGWREVQGESNKNVHNNCSSWVIYQKGGKASLSVSTEILLRTIKDQMVTYRI